MAATTETTTHEETFTEPVAPTFQDPGSPWLNREPLEGFWIRDEAIRGDDIPTYFGHGMPG